MRMRTAPVHEQRVSIHQPLLASPFASPPSEVPPPLLQPHRSYRSFASPHPRLLPHLQPRW